MAEPTSPKREIRFRSGTDDIFCLRMIGYNDFHYVEGWNSFRVYSWDSLHYVRSGRGKLFIRKKEYDIGPGDFFFIPKNEAIMYYPDEENPWQYYWVNFNEESKFDVGKKLGLDAELPVKPAKQSEEITALFDELFSSIESTNTTLYYTVLSVVMKIIALEHDNNAISHTFDASYSELIENAKRLIKLNCSHENFSAVDISKMLFISPQHLSRLFREYVGMTPVAYLSDTRLCAASELLRKNNYTVSELCRAVGFRDEHYFMKAFKKKYGMTIKEYRKSAAGKQ
ncbi:MAG: helix-turn-helix domain-containing protein [Oscillospiraceae bacterium]|nr:helix-turn-helix domain-containing protein [Oscillospiraceae bacterium]